LTGVRRLLFGSTAEEVVRLADKPVLVVKLPAAEEVPSPVAAGQPAAETAEAATATRSR
jgi:hypothetical protein